jgi:hypothetical protein
MPIGASDSGVTLADIVGAFSLATDLGLGLPMEHVLRSWVIAARLGDHVGLEGDDRGSLYYVATLAWVGWIVVETAMPDHEIVERLEVDRSPERRVCVPSSLLPSARGFARHLPRRSECAARRCGRRLPRLGSQAPVQQPSTVMPTVMAAWSRVMGGAPNCAGSAVVST